MDFFSGFFSGYFFGYFFPFLLHKKKSRFFLDIFSRKKNLEKNPKKYPDFLCSKNGKEYPKKYPEKNPKNIWIFLDGRS